MIEKINLETTELTANYFIVKPDPNYDFVEVKGVDGSMKIWMGYSPNDETKHVSISGTILKAPNELKYYGDILTSKKGFNVSNESFSSKMRNSMQYITTRNVKEGDKVYFDYHNQFDSEIEGRLINVEGEGYCTLMHYETFFGKEVDKDFVPLNGYVLFKRDQSEREYVTKSGLTIIQNTNIYEGRIGEVIAADKPLSGYLDRAVEDKFELKKGDKILINPKFGYRIAYELHAGEMKDYELIRRRHIYGIFDNIVSGIKKYKMQYG
jgi:co-chaperonin GroES (HSP10)